MSLQSISEECQSLQHNVEFIHMSADVDSPAMQKEAVSKSHDSANH